MNRFYIKKAVVAICFVLIIAAGFILNVSNLSLSVDFSAGLSSQMQKRQLTIRHLENMHSLIYLAHYRKPWARTK